MLRDNNAEQIVGDAGLEQVCPEYFKNIFTTSNPCSIESVVNSVEHVVSQDMNEALLLPITKEEALFQMNPSKAPSPYCI